MTPSISKPNRAFSSPLVASFASWPKLCDWDGVSLADGALARADSRSDMTPTLRSLEYVCAETPCQAPGVATCEIACGTNSKKLVIRAVVELGSTRQANAVVTSASPFTGPRTASFRGGNRVVLILPGSE